MTRVDVSVTPQPIRVTVEVPPVRILMRTHLWISWARIAIQHETMAKEARQELEQAAPENRDGYMLQREADAALVAICAAAFAPEALTRELDDLVTLPPATLAAWQRNPPPADRHVLELLKLSVDPRGLVAMWTRELAWLFGVRGGAVHYEGMNEPTQPHPVGMRTWQRRRLRTLRRTPLEPSIFSSAFWSGPGIVRSRPSADGPTARDTPSKS